MRFYECEEMKNDERFKFFNRCTGAEKKLQYVRLLKLLDKKDKEIKKRLAKMFKGADCMPWCESYQVECVLAQDDQYKEQCPFMCFECWKDEYKACNDENEVR